MNADQITDWTADADDVLPRLESMANDTAGSWSIGDRAMAWAAAELIRSAREHLKAPAPAAPLALAPPAAEKAAKGHRHSYGPDGRCTLSAEGGSGMCTAVSRASKKAAEQAPAAGGSAS